MRYDHPNFIVRREDSSLTVAGASGTHAQFMAYQKMRLVAAHVKVVVAGTSDSPGNSFTIRNGTDSIGLGALGTATAGVTTSVTVGSVIDSLETLNALGGTDATGVAQITWEFEVLPDAVQT